MMPNSITLEDLLSSVRAAQARKNTADEAVRWDKNRRSGSLFAQLIDALTQTPAETEAIEANAALVEARLRGRKEARAWVIAEAKNTLSKDPELSVRHKALRRKAGILQSRAIQTKTQLALAEDAQTALDEAVRACKAAAGMEIVDVASDHPLHSLGSHQKTKEAIDAIKEADRAVNALSRALPERVSSAKTILPHAGLDLLFDMVSMLNIHVLGEAVKRCEESLEAIRPLADALHDQAAAEQKEAYAERDALRAIEADFLNAAAARIPEELRDEVPAGFTP